MPLTYVGSQGGQVATSDTQGRAPCLLAPYAAREVTVQAAREEVARLETWQTPPHNAYRPGLDPWDDGEARRKSQKVEREGKKQRREISGTFYEMSRSQMLDPSGIKKG